MSYPIFSLRLVETVQSKIFYAAEISSQREWTGVTLRLEPINFASSSCVAIRATSRCSNRTVQRRARFFDHCTANIARPTSPNHDANRKTSSASPVSAARLCAKRRRPQRNETAPKPLFSSPLLLLVASLSRRERDRLDDSFRSARRAFFGKSR